MIEGAYLRDPRRKVAPKTVGGRRAAKMEKESKKKGAGHKMWGVGKSEPMMEIGALGRTKSRRRLAPPGKMGGEPVCKENEEMWCEPMIGLKMGKEP